MNTRSRLFVSTVLTTLAILVFGITGPAYAAPSPTSGPTTGGTIVTIPGINFIEVDAGDNFMVALTDQGTVYTWGKNNYGQLGDGTTTTSFTPVQVKGVNGVGYLTGVTHISAGLTFAVASTSDGMFAWGLNGDGQLGDGTIINRSTPVQVVGVGGTGFFPTPTAFSAGYYQTLAITPSGVFAWGYNGYGELGNNSLVSSRTPVQVVGVGGTGFLTGVTAVSAGRWFSTALGPGGVYTWGRNQDSQLGNGTTTNSQVPVQVKDSSGTGFLTGVSSISVGEAFTVALLPSGVFTWGDNTYRQLGDGTTVDKSLPVQVIGVGGTGTLSGITSIGTGNFSGWAQSSSGVFGWGSNTFGKLGNGNTTSPVTAPVQTLGVGGTGTLAPVSSLCGGYSATAAISNGQVLTWGYNAVNGQLGDGTTTDRSAPTLSANFQPASVTFGLTGGTSLSASGGSWSVVSPAGQAGTIALSATANIFGGTTPSTPATVAWNAGTFTYEPVLANTGSADTLRFGIISAAAILLGVGLMLALRRQQLK